MSLEQLLKENTEATLAQNELLKQLLAGTSGGAITAAATNTSTDADDGDTTDASDDTTQTRERGKPAPGKKKRTAAEIAEDEAADKADAAAAGGDDEGDGDAVTFADVQANLVQWLGEFGQPQDKPVKDETEAQKAAREEGFHPETKARKAAVKAVLNKLTGSEDGKLGMIKDDATKVAKLQDWIENKAKKADKGFGIGRLAADPEPADDNNDDDGLGDI